MPRPVPDWEWNMECSSYTIYWIAIRYNWYIAMRCGVESQNSSQSSTFSLVVHRGRDRIRDRKKRHFLYIQRKEKNEKHYREKRKFGIWFRALDRHTVLYRDHTNGEHKHTTYTHTQTLYYSHRPSKRPQRAGRRPVV